MTINSKNSCFYSKKIRLGVFIFLSFILCTASLSATEKMQKVTMSQENPFYTPSDLPFGVEHYDRLKEDDFEPAIRVGMEIERQEVEKIANNPAKPTFENVIEEFEKTGALLSRANSIFHQLVIANTNDHLDEIEGRLAPLLQAHYDSIMMNQKLFKRISYLYKNRDKLGLTPSQNYLLERQYRRFYHAGAALSPGQKKKLLDINIKIAELTSDYRRKLMLANEESALLIDDLKDLEGLSQVAIDNAAKAAEKKGRPGHYLLTLRNTTQQPLLEQLMIRETRTKLLQASENRGMKDGAGDVRALIPKLAFLRAQKAQLFGFKTYSDYTTSEQMAKSQEAAVKLLRDIVPAANHKASQEAVSLQSLIDGDKGGYNLGAQDWSFYANRHRAVQFQIDDSEVKQYFELNSVLENGVFYAANLLYGLTFKERHDIPVYDPDMRVFEVFEEDGSSLALFFIDPFTRPNKNGGAWCETINQPNKKDKIRPVVVNVENFTKPSPGQPALLSFDDVTTLFHEFGHALHAMFSVQYYGSQNGFNMPTDVIEFPSQFNEHWAMDPKVFINYAKHYQTGELMPAALVDKIKQAKLEGKGYATLEYVAAALLDMEWHGLSFKHPMVTDVAQFEREALEKNGFTIAAVPPRYHSSYFLHIWAEGYEANYYAYMWGEILDDDSYEWFQEHGGLTRENGQIFRDKLLGLGFTDDPMSLYRAFRGRNPSADAIRRERGLTF